MCFTNRVRWINFVFKKHVGFFPPSFMEFSKEKNMIWFYHISVLLMDRLNINMKWNRDFVILGV